MTIFAANGVAQTFDYQAGDISYVPAAYGEFKFTRVYFGVDRTLRLLTGHYVENTGNTTLRFIEVFNTDRFEDVSLAQWLGLIPPALVKEHLHLSDSTIASLPKEKRVVVGGKRRMS